MLGEKMAHVADMAPIDSLLNTILSNHSISNNHQTHAISAVSAIKEKEISPSLINNRVCGDCGKFHLSSCGFPNGKFETLATDWWAGELRCWIPKQPEMPEFLEEAPTIEA